MPFKITQKKEVDVPAAGASGKVNEELMALKVEMARLASGMVLEIEAESEKAVRGTKMLITRAANQLRTHWRHWSVGNKVFAKPIEDARRRGRPAKSP